jgi:hypothetical protein
VEIFRTTRNAWGQEALEGLSWDLLPVAFGVGVAVIVVHLIWRAVRGGVRPGAASPPDARGSDG